MIGDCRGRRGQERIRARARAREILMGGGGTKSWYTKGTRCDIEMGVALSL